MAVSVLKARLCNATYSHPNAQNNYDIKNLRDKTRHIVCPLNLLSIDCLGNYNPEKFPAMAEVQLKDDL